MKSSAITRMVNIILLGYAKFVCLIIKNRPVSRKKGN